MDAPLRHRFWEGRTLASLSRAEWEALCDGCGRCCLHKLEDEDTGGYHYTNVACHLLDLDTGRCRHYSRRRDYVPDCMQLTAKALPGIGWLPASCAYRRLAEGRPLPDWHPLLCGDREQVHTSGASVRGWTISEDEAGDLEDHVIS